MWLMMMGECHGYGDGESVRRTLKIFFHNLAKDKHAVFRLCGFECDDYDVQDGRRIWGTWGNHKVEGVVWQVSFEEWRASFLCVCG
jgi:hypothetical protein